MFGGLGVNCCRPVPDTNRTRDFNVISDDVSITEMSLNKEYAAALEAKQTTLGKTSTRFRNSVTALPFTRQAQSVDQESDQDGDTKRVNEGEETTDDIEAQDLTGSRTSSTNLDLSTPDTAPPVIRPAPELPKAHQEFEQDGNIERINGRLWIPTLSQSRAPTRTTTSCKGI